MKVKCRKLKKMPLAAAECSFLDNLNSSEAHHKARQPPMRPVHSQIC
jgi:hypothetical protein